MLKEYITRKAKDWLQRQGFVVIHPGYSAIVLSQGSIAEEEECDLWRFRWTSPPLYITRHSSLLLPLL